MHNKYFLISDDRKGELNSKTNNSTAHREFLLATTAIHLIVHTILFVRTSTMYQRWSEYNTNVLEYDYFEHA